MILIRFSSSCIIIRRKLKSSTVKVQPEEKVIGLSLKIRKFLARLIYSALILGLLAAILPACTPPHGASPAPSPVLSETPFPTRQPTAVPSATPTPTAPELAELAKFDAPEAYLPKSGPGGTQWDAPYRALIQTSLSAINKGLPSHPDAIEQIKADAAQSAEKIQLHKGYTLYIKHFSQSYRPEEATQALRQLFSELVYMEFGRPYVPPGETRWFEGEPHLTILRNIVYGQDNPTLQNLDAYLFKDGKPRPVLVELHGGGWRRGYKSQFEIYNGDLIGQILDQGIAVISINYRLTPQDYYPAQVQDVARAVQFIRSKASEWAIDPDRIALMGGSAGAHLGAWLALHDDLAEPHSGDPLARFSTRVNCFVDMAGPMDLTRVNTRDMASEGTRGADFARAYADLFFTLPEIYNRTEQTQKLIKEASPIFYVSQDDPSALIISNGTAEQSGPNHPPVPETINDPHSAWWGVLLADALEAAGVKTVRYIGPEVGKDPAKDNQVTLAFLKECLRLK